MSTPRPPSGRTTRLRRVDGATLEPGQGLGHVRSALDGWGLDSERLPAADALLVAGELLANAQQHGGGIDGIELTWTGTVLRIEVSDLSRQPPRLVQPHSARHPYGHGLHLVERLSMHWGSEPREGGKTVWVELAFPRAR